MRSDEIIYPWLRKCQPHWLITFFAIWVILAILFAFTDLRISQVLYRPETQLALWMNDYGPTPGSVVCFLGASILLRLRNRKRSLKNTTYGMLVFLVVLSLAMMTWVGWLSNVKGGIFLAVVLAGLSVVGVQFWLGEYPDASLQKFKLPGKAAILLFLLAPVITSWSIKLLWGRWSYQDVLLDLSRFSPWYLPQGPDGQFSFPSGHTSAAFLLLPITLLVPKNKPSFFLIWGLIIGWGLFMACSRVVLGVHFASDTLFGGCQTILWFFIIKSHL